MSNPVLYSFRRCPYAIRARIALYYSGVVCELREVVLKSKPAHMLSVSPKGTVPVLLTDGHVIEESIEVVQWALEQGDPYQWLQHDCDDPLIQQCDAEFKYWLDRYKYLDRYPDFSAEYYFEKAGEFLKILEQRLVLSNQESGDFYFLDSPQISVLDIAIFPFVRQFAFVDKVKFDALTLPKLQSWLEYFLNSAMFLDVMQKYPMWVEGETETVLFGQQ